MRCPRRAARAAIMLARPAGTEAPEEPVLRSLVCTTLLSALCLIASAARAENPVVRFSTIVGSYDVELCQELSARCPGVAPNTVANFLAYVDADRYPPTSFIHRRGGSADGASPLVVQGGGFWINGDGAAASVATFPPVARELGAGLSNLRGTIAMARSTGVNTATSQWFINLANNILLDGSYAVFGKVTDAVGMSVLDVIQSLTRYNLGSPFTEIPLIYYPGSGKAARHMVYVSSVERVPEPANAVGAAVAVSALAMRKWRRG